MKRLTVSSCLILLVFLGSAGESFALPACPGSYGTNNWTNCFGTYNYTDGEKYVGQFKDGTGHGRGTWTYANGDKYVGEFNDGKAKGKGAYTYANGDKTAGEFTAIIQPFLICNDPEKLFADGSVHLIYIDAANCTYCNLYKRIYLPNFKKQMYYQGVRQVLDSVKTKWY